MQLYTFHSFLTLFPAVLLIGLFVIQLFFRKQLSGASKAAFVLSVVGIFGWLGFLSWRRYISWQQNELTKHLVPPHGSPDYFLGYVGFRLFGPFLLALVLAGVFYFGAIYINKRYGERFFYEEEPTLGALGTFLVSWPSGLVYIVLVLSASVVGSLFLGLGRRLRGVGEGEAKAEERGGQKLSMFYLWILVAIFVILIRGWMLDVAGIGVLVFSHTF